MTPRYMEHPPQSNSGSAAKDMLMSGSAAKEKKAAVPLMQTYQTSASYPESGMY